MKKFIKRIIVILLGTTGLFFIYCLCVAICNFAGTAFFVLIAACLITHLSTDVMSVPDDYQDGDEILFRKKSQA